MFRKHWFEQRYAYFFVTRPLWFLNMLMHTAYFLEEDKTQEHGLGNTAIENVDSVKLLELRNVCVNI